MLQKCFRRYPPTPPHPEVTTDITKYSSLFQYSCQLEIFIGTPIFYDDFTAICLSILESVIVPGCIRPCGLDITAETNALTVLNNTIFFQKV